MKMQMGVCICTCIIALKVKGGKIPSFLGIKILNFKFLIAMCVLKKRYFQSRNSGNRSQFTQLALMCLKSTIETLKGSMKYVQSEQ